MRSLTVEAGFEIGLQLQVFQDGKEETEDEMVVVRTGVWSDCSRITLQSLKKYPGEEFDFVLTSLGWKYLFKDPMAEGFCFSQRGPSYVFQPKLED
jgi:hypothetical protein